MACCCPSTSPENLKIATLNAAKITRANAMLNESMQNTTLEKNGAILTKHVRLYNKSGHMDFKMEKIGILTLAANTAKIQAPQYAKCPSFLSLLVAL